MTRVLIVEDHPVFRRGMRNLLTDSSDIRAVGEAGDAHEALEQVRKEKWDVVLLDIALPGKNGLELLKELKQEQPKMPVLIVSAYPEQQYALRMLKAGASGYISKEKALGEVMHAIRKVLQGKKYVTEVVAEKLAVDIESGADKPAHELLSDREYEIMQLIAAGNPLSDIARRLHLSPHTVSTYRARILEKLRLESNSELVRYALDNKLIQ